MSRDGAITLPWGDDEEVTFRLGLRQWEKVQEKCDAGPPEIYRRLIHVGAAVTKGLTLGQAAMAGMAGDWRIHDVREVIVQALIGGGRADLEARALVQERVDRNADYAKHVALAYRIVQAALGDVPDEPLGESKGPAAARPKRRSRGASSGSRRSTATAS